MVVAVGDGEFIWASVSSRGGPAGQFDDDDLPGGLTRSIRLGDIPAPHEVDYGNEPWETTGVIPQGGPDYVLVVGRAAATPALVRAAFARWRQRAAVPDEWDEHDDEFWDEHDRAVEANMNTIISMINAAPMEQYDMHESQKLNEQAAEIGRQLIGEDAEEDLADELVRRNEEYQDGAHARRNAAAELYSSQKEHQLNTHGVQGQAFTDDEIFDDGADVDAGGYLDFVYRQIRYTGTFQLDAEFGSREDEFDLERADEVNYGEDTGQGFDDEDYDQACIDVGNAIRDVLRV